MSKTNPYWKIRRRTQLVSDVRNIVMTSEMTSSIRIVAATSDSMLETISILIGPYYN